jgi:zinc protease
MNETRKHPSARPALLSKPLKALLLALLLLAPHARGQVTNEPRREQLLNGLRILLVPRAGDADVVLKLRVHSGAAFDLAGKEGLMALLGDALFDAETREFVREDLSGRLEVSTDYDAIHVTLAARATDFERLLELLRNALMNTQLSADVVARLRDARLKGVGETSPATLADRAVSARLFGTHPYGRLVAGSPETVARVERTDLMLARDRFLNPNNSTLVIVGGFEPRRAMNTLRRLLGGWRKSDRVVPATFKQPPAADARTLIIDQQGAPATEVRLAVRGLGRADHDRAAAEVLASLARARWLAAMPGLSAPPAAVRHESHRDGGVFRMSASVASAAQAAEALDAARGVLRALAATPPSLAELDEAKRAVLSSPAQGARGVDGMAAAWLDEHSYNSVDVSGVGAERAVQALTPAEAQRVAARLFQHTPAAAVVVGDAAQLRVALARTGTFEVAGEPSAKPDAQPQPTPPQPKQPTLQLKRP